MIIKIVSTGVVIIIGFFVVYLIWTGRVNWIETISGKLGISTHEKSANFEISTEIMASPIEERQYPNEEPKTWRKINLGFRFSISPTLEGNGQTADMGIIYLSGDRLYATESQLADWITQAIEIKDKPDHHRILHHSFHIERLTSSQATRTDWQQITLSVDHTPWEAAIYVIPENQKPLWFQLSIKKGTPEIIPMSGNGVCVRDFKIMQTKKPIISAKNETLF